jgi:hypothetical protein
VFVIADVSRGSHACRMDGLPCERSVVLLTFPEIRPSRDRHRPVAYGPMHDLVGCAIARDLVLTGRKVDAQTALRLAERAAALARQASRAPREILIRNGSEPLIRPRTRSR